MKRLFLFIALTLFVQISHCEIYGVFVGISNYQDPKMNLPPTTSQDAISMYSYFKALSGKNDNFTLLTDGNATKQNIVNAIRMQFSKAKETDVVLFVFSGHGFPAGGLPAGFSTYKVNTEYLFDNELAQLYKQCRSKRKYCFANACFSGSLKQETKSAHPISPSKAEVCMFLSARANEMSWVLPYTENSFFFQRILEALQGEGNADTNGDGIISAYELFCYVHDKVVEDTGGKQHPVMFGKFNKNQPIVKYR